MNRRIVLFMVVIFSMVIPVVCFSEGQAAKESQKSEMRTGVVRKGVMMQKEGMRPMPSMMMKSMMEKSIVATQDGGVVVLVGNKLLKYDKNLNLQKEVEIKIDPSGMKDKMMPMQEKQKGCGGMMQQENKQEVPAEIQER
ncbi:MAG: hypothetical protein FJZ10_01335 [Candidatus Omnitrophica bacterium]|nr:hypothetical protein [Candidatus Omnitrophota bacterium]